MDGAKFCQKCGHPVRESARRVCEERQREYVGKIYKCPGCGEILKSFEVKCPACGLELRGAKATSSVREFALKLEAIEAKRELEKGNPAKADTKREISKTDAQKISLIRNYSIPNTKEDLFEFIVLAGANIREDRYDDGLPEYKREISDAWKAKFEQAYRKAKIAFKGDKSFREIENVYCEKLSEQKQAKHKSRMLNALMLVSPLIVFIPILGSIFLSDHISIKNETARLESIVEEVYTYIEQKQYILARSKVSTLVFSGSTTQWGDQAAEKWDVTRQQLLNIIDKAEYGADYVPEQREMRIRIGVSQDDLKDEDYSKVKTRLENRGFTNIKTEAVEDLITGWLTSEGSVDKVSVDGDTVFSENSVYPSNVEIIIYYHAKR